MNIFSAITVHWLINNIVKGIILLLQDGVFLDVVWHL